MKKQYTKKQIEEAIWHWEKKLAELDEALTIPASKAGPVELQLRKALEKQSSCKHEDVIVKCCRNEEKAGADKKQLVQTYVVGLGNIIDLLKMYDDCKSLYIAQKLSKKVELQRQDGKTVSLDPVKDFGKIGRLPVLKQFIDKLQRIVAGDSAIKSTFLKYAISDEDRKCIRLICWNSNVMVWGTRDFSPSQKFAVLLWQNIDTIDSGSAYGDPGKQCPYCTHSKGHWDNHADGDPSYEQYWYLKTVDGVPCTKKGDLSDPEVVKVYNAMQGLGPKLLVCLHDSNDDWCDRDDNPVSEYGVDIHDADQAVYLDSDGEAVGEDDDYDEEIEFVFGPGDESWLDDVIELYDSNFQADASKKKAWETADDYYKRVDGSKIVVSSDIENRSDEAIDIWRGNASLLTSHFKDGAVAISLPREVTGSLTVHNAEIRTLAGFPKASIVSFLDCSVLSLDSSIFKGSSIKTLNFENCEFGQDVHIADAFEGASIEKLSINKPKSALSFSMFMSLTGKKMKQVKEFGVGNCSVKSFDGLQQSVEDLHASKVMMLNVRARNFTKFFNEVDEVGMDCLTLDKNAGDGQFNAFPTVMKSLKVKLSAQGFDLGASTLFFKTAWNSIQDGCSLTYIEPDAPSDSLGEFLTVNYWSRTVGSGKILEDLKKVCEDSAPSRIDGLKIKRFPAGKISLKLSSRSKYDFKLFRQKCMSADAEDGVFDSNAMHVKERLSKMCAICTRDLSYDQLSYLAAVEDGSLKLFDLMMQPVDKSFSRNIVLGNMLGIGEQSGDEETLCNALIASYRALFPFARTLYVMPGFKKKVFAGIDDAKTTFIMRTDCVFSKCNVGGIYNYGNDSVIAVEDCQLSYDEDNALLYFSRADRCVFSFEGHSVLHMNEIHGCKIVSKGDVSIYSKTSIDNCSVSAAACRMKAPSIVNVIADADTVTVSECASMSNCKLNAKSTVTLDLLKSDESAAAVLKSIARSIKNLDISYSNVKSLSVLDSLQSSVEVDVVKANAAKLESLSFKLKKPGQVKLVSLFNWSCKDKMSLEGFDGSVALTLNVKPTDKDMSSSLIAKQFSKCFTVDFGADLLHKLADPKFIESDGRVHVPDLLDEYVQMSENLLWQHVLKLIR